MEGFSARLRSLRKARNLRQKDLAAELGLAQTTIANYEQNTRFPDEETLRKIVDYFNTSLDFLLGRSEKPLGPSIGPTTPPLEVGTDMKLTPVGRGYLELILGGEKERAVQLVIDECARGRPIQEIYMKILQPVLQEIGHRWEVAAADVYEEHLVSAVTVRVMARIMAYATPAPPLGATFVSVVAGGEQHAIGLRMVSDMLRIAGWHTLYLGVDIPFRSILKAVENEKADLLGISLTMQHNLNNATELIASIRAHPTCRDLKILVGGQLFRTNPDLGKLIGADAQAATAEEAVSQANLLLAARRKR